MSQSAHGVAYARPGWLGPCLGHAPAVPGRLADHEGSLANVRRAARKPSAGELQVAGAIGTNTRI